VIGASGNDVLTVGTGKDRVKGGPGNDRMNGNDGTDTLLGGDGDDTIDARDKSIDIVICNAGNDSVKADRFDRVAPSCETVTRGT
ncbi:MAG: calcium-binding protein, partial [Solirubrobacterales bacterium]|nr:calcium-binding protein [Solirubrobacterales bacterium]